MNSVVWSAIWLLAAETAASALNWRGLTILGRRGLPLTLLLLLVCGWWLATGAWAFAWYQPVLGAVIGLLSFTVLTTWLQRNRVPTTILAPGERDGRRIEHVAIPIAGGPLPALLVEPDRGSAIGVLVVHGAGDHKLFYAWPRLYELAAAGFAACAIDVDGHGDNPRVLDFPPVLENVQAGVAWLRERYRQVAVIGISQGGCIAARAVADGVNVDALVLMEAPITVNVTKAVIRREARILAHPAAWALHDEAGTIGLLQGWRTPPQRTRIGTIDLIERLDIVGSVRRVTYPLLLCYAGSDAVVPVAQAHTVAKAAPPGATFVLVPRATHLSLSIDRRVMRTIATWLDATLKAQQ